MRKRLHAARLRGRARRHARWSSPSSCRCSSCSSSASPSSAAPSRCGHALGRRPRGRAGRWRCRTTRPPPGPRSATPPPRSNPAVTDAQITITPAACPADRHGDAARTVRLTITYPMPFLTGFFGSGVDPHRNRSHAMQRLTDLFRRPARPTSAAPPRSSSRCCSSRCSASRPSPSTSARSTPSAPGCRSPPTPPPSPWRRTAPAATAATCSPPRGPWSPPTTATASAAQPVLSSAPLSVTVTGSTPMQHWFAPVIGHDSTAVSATRDRRLGRARAGAPPSCR